VIDVTGWENNWVDNLVSKKYKGNSTEISRKYIDKKKIDNYEYMSYNLSLQVWDCYI